VSIDWDLWAIIPSEFITTIYSIRGWNYVIINYLERGRKINMEYSNVRTLTDLLYTCSKEFGDTPALSFLDEEPWSYNQLLTSAVLLSKRLKKLGIEPGDRLALLAESSPQWGAAYFAGVITGAVMVPILPDFQTKEIYSIIDHSEAKGIIVSTKSRKKLTDGLKDLFMLDLEEVVEHTDSERTDDFEPARPDEDDLACIIYTSGTTGNSKGVMLSHRNILSNAFTAEKIPHWTEETKALSVLPLAHTYEFTIGFIIILIKGGTIFYLKRPPSTSVLLPALKKVRPHIMLSVPLLIEKIHEGILKTKVNNKFMLRTLYSFPPARKKLNKVIGKSLMETFGGRLHFFGVGGAPLAPTTEKFLREASFPFSIGYGLTETSPLIAGGNSAEIPFHTTGKVLENLECKLDYEASSASDGEILVRGPSVMAGYYKNEKMTKEVLTDDKWFRTGDLGSFSPDGMLTITGRVKNMILGANGENIYPEQIETTINEDHYVLESLVLQVKETKELVARVHLDYETFAADQQEGRILKEFHNLERNILHRNVEEEHDRIQKRINAYLDELKNRINRELPQNSRISRFMEQKEPFERTPTKKIKRYLYSVDAS
jgi:long-chain acyl-CoA synthetase